MTPSKTSTKLSGTSSEKSKSVQLRVVENNYVTGMCLEMKVGDLYYRKTVGENDAEALDYAVGSMLKLMLGTIVDSIGEDHKRIKEQLCTS